MPRAAVPRPTPRPTVTAIARISGGKARIASITRIAIAVRSAAEGAGEEPDQAADQGAAEGDQKGEHEGDAGALRDPGENVAAELVGAHRVGAGG